ncbi:helix-turn-helix domain-containing protein [Brevibacillus centrosporus]|uniref:helix-turn-helix domain-containing protein n=1 Tax=Brevibacillus centrosporus TaxID=54910 RepID=UPI003B029319
MDSRSSRSLQIEQTQRAELSLHEFLLFFYPPSYLTLTTYRQITEHFGIQDKDRVKKWMKKYKQLGEFGFLDQRGRRQAYIDQDRYVQQLRRENHMLKKCWEIWMREVQHRSTPS